MLVYILSNTLTSLTRHALSLFLKLTLLCLSRNHNKPFCETINFPICLNKTIKKVTNPLFMVLTVTVYLQEAVIEQL